MEAQCDFGAIITEDSRMKEILKTAERVAPSDVNILLTGESGTGKNLLAKAIHSGSRRHSGPFVPVNCLAIPETLIESELFGHEKGAFTDAHTLKKGNFESANGGTLYLDEIGDMTLSAQGKILQAIEESCFRRVGGEKLIVFNARIIASTNRDLGKRIGDGGFREDLYYRLKEVSLHLSPLRERREDIPRLIRAFVRHYCQVYGKPELDISNTALGHLKQYPWPGNIRELENIVKSAVILCTEKTLWLEHFPFEIRLKSEFRSGPDEDFSVDAVLLRHLSTTLRHFGWNKKRAAAALRISRPRLDRYIKKFGLPPP